MSQNQGLYWHVHHLILFEYCYDAKERREYIKHNKSRSEVPVRLKLMKPIKNLKGFGRLLYQIKCAEERWEKLRKEYRAGKVSYSLKSKAWYKLFDLKTELCNKFDLVAEQRHKEECKNCPWDGHTIFPREPLEEGVTS